MKEFKLSKAELEHLKWVLVENGIGKCKCCKNLYERINDLLLRKQEK